MVVVAGICRYGPSVQPVVPGEGSQRLLLPSTCPLRVRDWAWPATPDEQQNPAQYPAKETTVPATSPAQPAQTHAVVQNHAVAQALADAVTAAGYAPSIQNTQPW